jgi:oxygen-independent coproporphyrinogen-3 oxidase
MDHFALETDELSRAYEKKRLQRNFQGYTVLDVDDLIGFGVTSIGYVQNCYVQNGKDLSEYYKSLDKGELATFRGKVLDDADLMRRWVIQRLMCDFRVQKEQFFQKYGHDFDTYFERELVALEPFVQDGFVIKEPNAISVTKEGELFVRNITATFDWYLCQKEGHKSFSKAI